MLDIINYINFTCMFHQFQIFISMLSDQNKNHFIMKRGSGDSRWRKVSMLYLLEITRANRDVVQRYLKKCVRCITNRKSRLRQRFTSIAAVAFGIRSKYQNGDIASRMFAIYMDLSETAAWQCTRSGRFFFTISAFVNINRDTCSKL